jgi:hypothetical protein
MSHLADTANRIAENMVARTTGPLHFRFVLQPLMAMFFAVRDGLKDAKTGNPPYFWSLMTVPGHRREMMKDGWHSVGKIFILAMVLDVAYQFIVEHFVYLGEAIIVSFVLAIVPYLIVRGLVTRFASRSRR